MTTRSIQPTEMALRALGVERSGASTHPVNHGQPPGLCDLAGARMQQLSGRYQDPNRKLRTKRWK